MAKAEKPDKKPKAKPKLTDEERHKRFVAAARDVGASEVSEDFDRAFDAVALPKTKRSV